MWCHFYLSIYLNGQRGETWGSERLSILLKVRADIEEFEYRFPWPHYPACIAVAVSHKAFCSAQGRHSAKSFSNKPVCLLPLRVIALSHFSETILSWLGSRWHCCVCGRLCSLRICERSLVISGWWGGFADGPLPLIILELPGDK